jgi:hypothetical protein
MGTIPTNLAPVALAQWPADRAPVTPRWTVAELLSARCVSIGELSRTAGISWQAAWRAAHGHGVLTMPTRRKVAAALAIEPDAIRWPEAGDRDRTAGQPRRRTAARAVAHADR